tara:strand:+ start:8847 stop:9008 length:162 start_codon:yes stop_codon:yes gene_type:complete
MFEDEYLEARQEFLFNELNKMSKEKLITMLLKYSGEEYLEALTSAIKGGMIDV